MQREQAEVLVVGAGPTGLFIAAELARHGVTARIIDQNPTPHTQTRATGVQPAALEVLQRAGVADAMMEAGLPVKGVRILDARLEEAYVTGGPAPGTPFPYTLSLPQWRTEEILNAHLARLGRGVERGVKAAEVQVLDAGAEVRCVGPDGTESIIEARYLIGAGGAHSPVRAALHEQLEGQTYPSRYLVADVIARDVSRHDQRLNVVITPAGMLMIVELPQGRSLLVMDLPDDVETALPPTLDDVRRGQAIHLEESFPVEDLRWSSVYRTHRRMAPRFFAGHCFLAGDAAHLCSPAGGEGMNSGFLDGATLGWQLAGVLRQGGRPSLLAAYEPERQDASRQVIASSDAVRSFYHRMALMAAAGQPLVEPPPDPTLRVTTPSMLDLTIFDSPILGFHGSLLGPRPVRPGCRFPARTQLTGSRHHLLVWGGPAEVDGWPRALEARDGAEVCPPEQAGVGERGAVLVRPDGYIGFQAETWDAAARAAFERFFGGLYEPGR